MDLETFTQLVTDPARTRDELKQMLDNALNKGAKEHAAIAKDQLDARFPEWNAARSRRGGAKPTVVTFRGEEREFPSGKEAYIWLVERFIGAQPQLFSDPSGKTMYLALGRNRSYFGRSVGELFQGTPALADNPANYTMLSQGWFANVHMSNARKFDILMRFGALTEQEYGTDWDWKVLDPTEELMDRQDAVLKSRELRKRLRALIKARTQSAG